MPYEIVGKTTFQRGKALWEILGNLRNHGVGRIVARNQYETRYPEPTWYRIVQVQPLPPQGKIQVIPPILDLGEVRCVNVLVDKIFRGKYHGRQWIGKATYKPDFKLIPKEEEESYTSVKRGELPESYSSTSIFPSHCSFPPLLKELVIRDLKARKMYAGEEPKLQIVYRDGVRVALEGEVPNRKILLRPMEENACSSLYSTVKES